MALDNVCSMDRLREPDIHPVWRRSDPAASRGGVAAWPGRRALRHIEMPEDLAEGGMP